MFVRFFALRVGFLGKIQAEASFPGGFVRAVAFETAVGKNWPDVAIELKLLGVQECPAAYQKFAEQNADEQTPTGTWMLLWIQHDKLMSIFRVVASISK